MEPALECRRSSGLEQRPSDTVTLLVPQSAYSHDRYLLTMWWQPLSLRSRWMNAISPLRAASSSRLLDLYWENMHVRLFWPYLSTSSERHGITCFVKLPRIPACGSTYR